MAPRLWMVMVAALVTVPPLAFGQGTEERMDDDESGYTGGPVEVTMYHHIYNLLDKVPMNTQPMDEAVPDIARGFTPPTVSTPAGEAAVTANNYLYMYNSPGPVHYNTSLKEPRYHPERGLAEDLVLAPVPMTVYWYMSAEAGDPGSAPVAFGAIPQVTVRATIRLGDDVGGDLDAGEIVSQGQVTVDVVTQPNAPPMEIVIPMEAPRITVIPKDISYNLKLDWFQIDDGGLQYMDGQWSLHSGVNYPNRLVWTLENPLRINYVHPQPIGDRKLAFHTAFVTPFGNYDVDLNRLRFTVRSADGETVTPKSLQGPIIVQKTWVHNHHFEPVLATWVWNYREDGTPPGDYAITIETANFQGNAIAIKAARFTLAPEGKATGFSSSGEEIRPLDDPGNEAVAESPLGLVPLALALGAAVALGTLRRRR